VVALLLSSMWLVPLATAGQVVDAGRGRPTHFPALLGPALAAVIVSWRGYALPALERRFTPLTATVLVSVGWGV
jgi:membrane protease YdiL (CAAX protease family)